uniref:NmrA-like domain-containing protein n=1 Tax=Bionectria ochroleuca TaxID=29856 RepID=A0A8H7KBI3_BIOOC
MVHTVALLAPNGNVGSAALRHLLPTHKAAKLNLVVLHRPGSPPKDLDLGLGVEVREIDLEGPIENIQEAVRGVNAAISALPISAIHLQINLVRALSKTPGFITFIPARFSIPLTDDDYPHLSFMEPFLETERIAKELGVGITHVWTGSFIMSFKFGWLGTNLQENKIVANANQLKNWTPIITMEHLGAALGNLLARDPADIVGKSFSAVTFRPSGKDFVNTFTQLHDGQPTAVVDQTPEDLQLLLQDIKGSGAFMGVYMRHWDRGDLEFPGSIPASDGISLSHEFQNL